MSGRDQLVRKIEALGIYVNEDPEGMFILDEKVVLIYYGGGFWTLSSNLAIGEWKHERLIWRMESKSPKKIAAEVAAFFTLYL